MRNARAQECVGRRALVTHDDDGEGDGVGGAHSWWACGLVTTGMSRQSALVAPTLGAAADVVAKEQGSLLLTPHQAWWLGARNVSADLDKDLPEPSDGDELACPVHGPLSGATAVLFSREYVYELATLATRADRGFRKKCRRAEAELAARALHVEPFPGAAITDGLIDACECCRNKWMARRAADSRAAARRAGVRYTGPPWAGVPKRSQFLQALRQSRGLPHGSSKPALALFVVREKPLADAPTGATASSPCAGSHGAVMGYVVTERVGRTVVAVDGVHDYSLEDPRADPSALLLHVAAQWWCEAQPTAPPRWLNDGPVPTPGLLKYKHDICRGKILYLLCFGPGQRCSRSGSAEAAPRLQRLQDLHDSARARRRFAMLLASYRRRRKLHVGAEAIKRAASRMYGVECRT